MLNVFRENLKHLKWVLLAVVGSFILTIFAVWGGGIGRSDSGSDRTTWAARVGDQVIGVDAFQREARNLEYTYRQILGTQFEQQRPFLKVGQSAVNRLVDRELLSREAAKAGLEVSDQEVAESIMKDPSFQQNGVFIGKERYEQIFRSNQAMLEDYERQVQQELLLNKLRFLLEDSVAVSDAELREAFALQNEKISLQYFVLEDSRLPAPPPPESKLEEFYRQHLADYPSGEGRTGRFVLMDQKEIAAKMELPEAEVRSEYLQGEKTLYSTPDKRRASHILVKLPPNPTPEQTGAAEAKAKKILTRVRGGEDFAKVAREASEDSSASAGGDLGAFSRDQMVKEFSDAVWSLKVGQISDPVRSPFGFHIIRLTEIQPAHEMTLEEARPLILASLKASRAREEVQRLAQDFTAKVRGAGGDFAKAAASAGLKVRDFQGLHKGEEFPGLGAQPALERQLFDLKNGEVGDPVMVSSGVAVLQFLSATPGGPLPFQKVKERIGRDLARETRVEAARKLIAAAGGTADLAATAKKLKVELKSAGPVPRSGPLPQLGDDPDLLPRLFALKSGETLGPLGAPGGVAVIRMLSHTDPMEGFESQKEQLLGSLLASKRDRLFRAYVERLRGGAKIEINAALVDQIDRT
jgi:peptidyl-prolyl cis-trans isomerase D